MLRTYPDARINARAHSFPVRVVPLWNRLPVATMLQTFKTSVRNIDFSYAFIGMWCKPRSGVRCLYVVICAILIFLYGLLND